MSDLALAQQDLDDALNELTQATDGVRVLADSASSLRRRVRRLRSERNMAIEEVKALKSARSEDADMVRDALDHLKRAVAQ